MRNLHEYHYEQKTVAEVRIIITTIFVINGWTIIIMQDKTITLPSISLPAYAPMAIAIPELQPVASPLTVTESNQPQAW
jgi:hypothetical protein